MSERVTTIRLRAEIADLKRQMAEAGVAVKGVGDQAEKAGQRSTAALGSLSNTAGLLGLAMVAAAGMAVKAFADFDQSMSAVEAATHESAANMGLLRDAALEAGKRTVFSATEAAGAVEELAKAGLSTADILGGALNGALDLASAGALSVTEAAGTMSVALAQFKLPGTDASHVADLLAAGANKAMGNVSDLGMALRQAGQVANSTGLTIEETTAGLSAFAKAGLIGSDAGTSFKSMLQRLTPQSAEAQAKMDELGISAYDAGGNFIGLANFAGNLQGALKDLTPEQRNAAEATIFGSDAVRAANVLYDEGAAGIAEWITKVDDSGYAAETAAIRLDNLKGDFEQLSGSVETAMIGLGEGANGPLRDLVQGATNFVNAFAGAPAVVQGLTLSLVGGGGLVLLGIAGMGKLLVAISETRDAMAALNISGGAVKGTLLRLGAVGAALGLATVLLKVADAAQTASVSAEELKNRLTALEGGAAGVDAVFSDIGQGWADNLSTLSFDVGAASADDLRASLRLLNDQLDGGPIGDFSLMMADIVGTDGGLRQFGIRVRQIGDELGSLAASDLPSATEQFNSLVDAAGGGEEVVAQLINQMPDYRDALYAAATAQGVTLDETTLLTAATGELALGQGEVAGAYDVTTESIAAQIPTLEDLISAQAEAAGVVLSERDAQRAFQAAIDDATAAIETNGLTLDIGTAAGRANQAALDGIADKGHAVQESMQALGATQGELQAAMQVSRDAFVTMAIAEGMGADEANRLADKMGLIPAKVGVDVTANIAGAVRDVEALKAILRTIPDVVITASMRNTGGYYANRAAGGTVQGPRTAISAPINPTGTEALR